MNFCVCRQQQICNSWQQICNFWQFVTNRLYIIANLSPFNHTLITRLIVDQFRLDAPKLLWRWQRLQVVAHLEPIFKETISKATRFVSLVMPWFAASVFCSVTIALGHHPTFINKILAQWHTFPVFHCWHQHQSVSRGWQPTWRHHCVWARSLLLFKSKSQTTCQSTHNKCFLISGDMIV